MPLLPDAQLLVEHVGQRIGGDRPSPSPAAAPPLARSVTRRRGAPRGALGVERRPAMFAPSRQRPSRRRRGSGRRRTVRPARRSRRRRRTRASAACRRDHVQRLGDDRALDAAAGDRAEEVAVVVDHEIGLPTGRGAEPQVSTTVASATPSPGLLPVFRGLENIVVVAELAVVSLRLRIRRRSGVRCRGCARQRIDQSSPIDFRLCIGPEFVNMRQHRSDAPAPRLEADQSAAAG